MTGKFHLWNPLNTRKMTYFPSVQKNPTVKQYNTHTHKNSHIPFALTQLFIHLVRSSILITGAISSYSFYNQDLHIISYSALISYYYAIIHESTALWSRQSWTQCLRKNSCSVTLVTNPGHPRQTQQVLMLQSVFFRVSETLSNLEIDLILGI